MLRRLERGEYVLGRGVYGAAEGVRLLNFRRGDTGARATVALQTIRRWLRGYDYVSGGERRHSGPLWNPDYTNDDSTLELSFRDLVELRFVKAFRDAGLSLPTIRTCFTRAVEEVRDERPFSTRRFRTDGRAIFLEITEGVGEGELIDLKRRQKVFHSIVEPSLRDLEFDADVVARWYPLGTARRTVVIDPTRAFGRPISEAGVPTQVLAHAVVVEGSIARVADLYRVAVPEVRDALAFEQKLAA